MRFKLVPGTSLDGIVASLQAAENNDVIEIRIERDDVEVRWRSAAPPSVHSAMEGFQEMEREEFGGWRPRLSLRTYVEIQGASEMAQMRDQLSSGRIMDVGDAFEIQPGCPCVGCSTERARRGF